MTPIEYYHQQCKSGAISEDPEQIAVIKQLEQLYVELIAEQKRRSGLFSFLKKPQLLKGIYLWGGVGIGKTLMMDCFYHCLPFKNKLRMHFHAFMQRIHNALTQHQGEKNPLQTIAKEIARETMVLCFDELFVSDIADAMVLAGLFKALFAESVALVTTSNIAPDDLYKNGLQRLNFLPAIALIKENTNVIHLGTTIDYRLRHLKEAGVFYTPLDEKSKASMEKTFEVLSVEEKIITTPIEIFGREIPVIKRTDKIIWFDFNVICAVPRSQKDYLKIAEMFQTIFISDIPLIGPDEKDKICLFISLVDVFYDAGVRIVISAAEPVAEIYSRGYMILEYTRTHSRLTEMQSSDYFAGEFSKHGQ